MAIDEEAQETGAPPDEGGRSRPGGFRQALKWTGLGILALFLLIQLVPYGWPRHDPPVTRDAPWPDAESAAIAHRSCYSCHSNESKTPVYEYVAPASWLVRYDIERGRKKLNFSEWDKYSGKASDAIDQVLAKRMPLGRYTLIHPSAKLSQEDITKLVGALTTMDQEARSGSSGSGSDGSGSNSGTGGSDGGSNGGDSGSGSG
jgi:Haem-binding domain